MEVIRHDLSHLKETRELKPDVVLKDPYILDFLGLNDRYLERDLEDAILREMEQFLLELGAGFTFVARQKRLQIDDDGFCALRTAVDANVEHTNEETAIK